jgi:hypothetical protein
MYNMLQGHLEDLRLGDLYNDRGPYVNVSSHIFKSSNQNINKSNLILHNQTLIGFSVFFSARKNCLSNTYPF